MSSFLKSSVPLYMIAISTTFTGAAVWFFKDKITNTPASGEVVAQSTSIAVSSTCKPMLERVRGYNYIAPLLYVESECESDELASLGSSLIAIIDQQKLSGVLKDASFYFRDLDKGLWTGYREDDKYYPGSLMKVPDLMSYLIMEEHAPGTLSKTLHYGKSYTELKKPVFISKKLPEDGNYTVKELLHYMISYSDNNATLLLSNSFDEKYFKKVLADFHLPAVEPGQKNYPLSPREFSRFMRSIYNASYLTSVHSEYAAELLSTCDFKEGFAKGFPPGTKFIHKFGEAGNAEEKQLHESAIIYINGHGYLFTVMTKGTNELQLTPVLSEMAATVYKYLTH